MRISFAFVLVIGLVACGGNTPAQPGDDDPDAGVPSDGDLLAPTRGFQIKSPTIDINGGVEVTYCYYFQTPNTGELSIKKWASRMSPGSHHMILYLTSTPLKPPGTVSTDQCGFGGGGRGPVWTYSAQTANAEAALPLDDGNGLPVGQQIKAGQSGFIQMHYLNSTDEVIHAHVELNGYAYEEGVQVTQAAPFVTYSTMINLSPGSAVAPKPGMVVANCTVPTDAKFYVVSTHTHKQGVHTSIKDGASDAAPTVFDSTSWEHPGEKTWGTTPFFSFASGKLRYQCEYMNPNNYSIVDGDSAATEEMCMAIGYFFPAPARTGSAGHLCLDGNPVY